MSAIVREATAADAVAAVAVLTRSISALCVADHGNDPSRLRAWLENKTVQNTTAWIGSPDNYCLVALIDNVICGFSAISRSGTITLCYVDPSVRFRRVSSAMLKSLEEKASSLGLTEVRLESTATARRFYEERGYFLQSTGTGDCESDDPPVMMKSLVL